MFNGRDMFTKWSHPLDCVTSKLGKAGWLLGWAFTDQKYPENSASKKVEDSNTIGLNRWVVRVPLARVNLKNR